MSVFRIQTFTLDSINWTPITVPVQSNFVTIANKSGISISLRTDPANSATEDTLAGDGSEQDLEGTWETSDGQGKFRFQAGNVICYAKAASATPTIIVRFLQ